MSTRRFHLQLSPSLYLQDKGDWKSPGGRIIAPAFVRLLVFDESVREFAWVGTCPYCNDPVHAIGWPARGGIVGHRFANCCDRANRDGLAVVVEASAWPGIQENYFARRPRR
ncbi:MAG: hypothetical protein L6R28_07170 [Planctomycetes bacterium]|nr:hypothetical protein [Planctomycetota bacterium]